MPPICTGSSPQAFAQMATQIRLVGLPVCGVAGIGCSDMGVRRCQCRATHLQRKAAVTRHAGCADARLDERPHAAAQTMERHCHVTAVGGVCRLSRRVSGYP